MSRHVGGELTALVEPLLAAVIQEAWGGMWPPDKYGFPQEIARDEMSTLLNAFEHGEEGETALDFIYVSRLGPRQNGIAFPRGNLMSSLHKHLHPEERKSRPNYKKSAT